MEKEFGGVFHFSNNSDEEFVVLWNNKEYVFPPKSCSPIIIPTESSENIQEIRKKWAYKWAEREWYKGKEYKKMANMGGGLPPTRDDTTLEPLIEMCLIPLPIGVAQTREGKKEKRTFRGSKAVSDKENLNVAFAEESKEENLVKLGTQANEIKD